MADRVEITKEEYFASLDSALGAEIRDVIEAFIKWAHERDLVEYYSTGERGPAFTPRIQRPDKSSNVLLVQSNGWIVIPIRWMSTRLPFSDILKRQKVIDRIKEIPDAVITEKGSDGFPKVRASSLASPEAFQNFIKVSDWVIEEIKRADGAPLERQIWVYGNPDKSDLGFQTDDHLTSYIKGGVFETEGGHYRHTLNRHAGIIILSRDGLAFGHFEVGPRLAPSESDIAAYPRVKSVYPVIKTALYKTQVHLADVQISGIQFGRQITEEKFEIILDRAGGVEEFHNSKPAGDAIIAPDGPSADEISKATTAAVEAGYFSPESLKDERTKKFREIVERRGQPAFRNNLCVAYGSRCAVTGCDAVAALEAAHIVPYTGPESNHITNGLLLRADIHTLFDLNLIGIDPDSLTISVATAIATTSYAEFKGQKLDLPVEGTEAPNYAALMQRWKQFRGESNS